MKGYVEITVSEKIKQKIDKLLDTVVEFREQHLVTPKGKWVTESAWFGLTTRKFWQPDVEINVPFGLLVHDRWFVSVTNTGSAMPLFEYEDKEVINVLVDIDNNYEGMVALRNLLKNNNTILIDDKLTKILNRVKEI